MERANKITFEFVEREADIYEKEAHAQIAKEKGDEDMSEVAALLQMGRRVIYRLRQELANRVEVVRGVWKRVGQVCVDGEYVDTYRCSKCGIRYEAKSRYCPNCGAKMDGDGNG